MSNLENMEADNMIEIRSHSPCELIHALALICFPNSFIVLFHLFSCCYIIKDSS